MNGPTNPGTSASNIQQQVDELADAILSRGVRPTAKMLAAQLDAPIHRLKAALEDWARRLGHGDSGADRPPRSGIDFIAGLPRERRQNAMFRAAHAAAEDAARRKADAQQLIRRDDLQFEIERARARLERLEERRQNGEDAPHIGERIEKARARLLKMRDALAGSSAGSSD